MLNYIQHLSPLKIYQRLLCHILPGVDESSIYADDVVEMVVPVVAVPTVVAMDLNQINKG